MNRNGVLWVGANQSRYWPRQPKADWAVVAMPLTEACVLRTAFDPSYNAYRRLSRTAALGATSRLAQRVSLASTGFNPKWQPCPWQSGVVKAPTSVENQGVGYLRANWYTRNLHRYAPELSAIGVVEEWLDGEAWEQDGYIVKGQCGWFWPLRQRWDSSSTKIRKYQRAKTVLGPDDLREATAIAVRTIGLDDCCFCAEWRLTKKGWKLIEIQARLGQDEGLAELLVDGGKPLQTVESAVREAYGVPAEPAPQRIVAARRHTRLSSLY
ncbi:MAG TPA: hypothetical protein VKG25_03405 [Bryobacteraceae bacterium]|nr:hypothetical protein [Bryobacteraceae bacterium]